MRTFAATSILVGAMLLGGCASQPTVPSSSDSAISAATDVKGGRPATTGVVYVSSQGLYYDTFVTNDPLPMHGLSSCSPVASRNLDREIPAI